jgi:hypothetical protein
MACLASTRSTCGEPSAWAPDPPVRGAGCDARRRWYLVPLAITRALQQVIALRKRRDELAASTYARRHLERRLDRLLAGTANVAETTACDGTWSNIATGCSCASTSQTLTHQQLSGTRIAWCGRDPHSAGAIEASNTPTLTLTPPSVQTAHRQGTTMTNFVTRWPRPAMARTWLA